MPATIRAPAAVPTAIPATAPPQSPPPPPPVPLSRGRVSPPAPKLEVELLVGLLVEAVAGSEEVSTSLEDELVVV